MKWHDLSLAIDPFVPAAQLWDVNGWFWTEYRKKKTLIEQPFTQTVICLIINVHNKPTPQCAECGPVFNSSAVSWSIIHSMISEERILKILSWYSPLSLWFCLYHWCKQPQSGIYVDFIYILRFMAGFPSARGLSWQKTSKQGRV